MELVFKVLSLLVIGVSVSESAKFPKNWKNCKNDEKLNDCLKDALQNVIPFFVEGIPNLGVHSLDPLHFDQISIGKGSGPVSLDLDFMDFDVTGIKDVTVDSVDTDWKIMRLEGSTPKLELKGKYKIDGKVLVLPVTGLGDCLLEMDNFRAHVIANMSEKSTGSKTYYNIDHMDFHFDTDLLKLHFDNLFNGDKALGDQMNIFVNENWKEILTELRPAVAKSFAMAFKEIGNRVFTKIPKDLITPP
ncbi:hypothetical protein GE061_006379 [Apolygus lucorum]|uniref:Protein takeout n=1 Tax=Apolygus lucorum TaxID=248454 RepID=A0A8S9WVF2_APOLU|nr:hypothetical protein GE061_006379 [Apolygus lucorum]